MQINIEDKIVQNVVNSFLKRSKSGIDKYGVTLDKNKLEFKEWLQHAQEEAMDMVLYLERAKMEL
jgi:hypothetical protein